MPPDHVTEPFGDPATSWVTGRMPVGWRVTESVTLDDPRTRLRMTIERRVVGAMLPALVFAQDELDALLAQDDPTPLLVAGLSAFAIEGLDSPAYSALVDLPGTPDVRLSVWAAREREQITVTAQVPRRAWPERAAEIMAVVESLGLRD